MNGMSDITHGAGTVQAYRSEPGADVPVRGALLVVHEVWGLVDQIKRVADRFAAEGYLVLAPDLFAHRDLDSDEIAALQAAAFGSDPEARNRVQPRLRELMAPLNSPDFSAAADVDLRACFDELTAQPGINGRVGVVGFCFGGSQAYSLAVHEPRLRAAVPFYGQANYSVAELGGIRCRIQAFYGANDVRLMAALPEFRQQLSAAGVDFRAEVFPDCGHAFFNETNLGAFNANAATRAWRITLDFLSESLAG
ncbi:dienelactone hydrolase family protein [Glaciibacter psychrotolerans]|uniref:Carboxymethylenebutenolidase n=1 Tax=Glaciibacter psychrotolerans TaxID=670054 RepID=A0A7Z0EGB5_9MICO|nr:dienelactone hydrolase family protein [Leifsonia psychrotolerans]NYJ20414.1 carboxymethylenebutenolidase [Leifsonia psychrotolerans]